MAQKKKSTKKVVRKKSTKKPVRKKTTKRPRKKRKSKFSFNSWRKSLSVRFGRMYERIGKMTIFLLILGVLFILLIFQLDGIRHNPGSNMEIANQEERQTFVETIAPISQRLQREYGIFASVSMAQAMLESEFGQSQLAAEHKNLFGVKTEATDPQGADYQTLEYIDDEWIEITDRFKVYPNWEASLRAHAELIYYGTSWDSEFYSRVIEADTPFDQAEALQSAGYATDPDYADKLVGLINEYNLTQYDQPVVEESTQ